MNIILNFVPLKSGGGLQVGLDFVNQAKQYGRMHEWFLVATAGTPLAKVAEAEHFHVAKIVPRNLAFRVWFEYIGCRNLIKKVEARVIYTQFGPHWPGVTIPNIVGCAYSNLFYPEIDFWEKVPFHRRILRKVIDIARMKRLRHADHIIFETEDLAHRAVRVRHIPEEHVSWVKPSVSSLVTPACTHERTRQMCNSFPPGYRVLLLSTFNEHKNIDLIPDILRSLENSHNINDVMFVLTLPPTHRGTMQILEKARVLGVTDRILNAGPIPQEGCAELYRACDAVILPSQLESFSNTIAEAWAMGKPLLISNLEWAHSLCRGGAAYFTYNNPDDAARLILRLKNDLPFRNTVTSSGKEMLLTYNRPEQRFDRYLSLIERYAA